MENNEQLEVINTTEEIIDDNSKNGVETKEIIGLAVLGGLAAYNFIYKPIKTRVRRKKEFDETVSKFDEYSNEKEFSQNNEIKEEI